jgi:hypothetical protein
MKASLRRYGRRAALVTAVAGSCIAAGSAAHASVPWGGMYDYYNSNLVATGSGTVFYTGNSIEQTSRYEDRRADGYGAYTQANFQPFWHTCYPDPAICHWEWGDITTRQTKRIGTADGIVNGYGTVTRVWPTNRDYAQVCIDIPLHSDPCVSSPELYP